MPPRSERRQRSGACQTRRSIQISAGKRAGGNGWKGERLSLIRKGSLRELATWEPAESIGMELLDEYATGLGAWAELDSGECELAKEAAAAHHEPESMKAFRLSWLLLLL
mmetsp:Transcript_17871/g.40952  ORF Transcript_17871/g.40952 Transcript_17871/m.40952 type:complete len:110 (+) Transcript_17871:1036-1365(+)